MPRIPTPEQYDEIKRQERTDRFLAVSSCIVIAVVVVFLSWLMVGCSGESSAYTIKNIPNEPGFPERPYTVTTVDNYQRCYGRFETIDDAKDYINLRHEVRLEHNQELAKEVSDNPWASCEISKRYQSPDKYVVWYEPLGAKTRRLEWSEP